jgi:hypothetical protein
MADEDDDDNGPVTERNERIYCQSLNMFRFFYIYVIFKFEFEFTVGK